MEGEEMKARLVRWMIFVVVLLAAASIALAEEKFDIQKNVREFESLFEEYLG